MKHLIQKSLFKAYCVTFCSLVIGSLGLGVSLSHAGASPAAAGVQNPKVVMETTAGKVEITLYKDRAPKTVENFLGLATGKKEWVDPITGKKMKGKSLYSGTIFHRVIPGFMIQGGDPMGTGVGGPGYEFADETSPQDQFDRSGLLAMANSGPNTNGSQFFITVKATPWLNGRHTIFGEVTAGMDVVDKIISAQRDARDRPLQPIKIKKISIR